MNSGMFLRP